MVKTVKKGSITIFLALILSLILSLVSASIESVRMSAARTQILNSMDIGLYSLFGQYDRFLLKNYDLFFLDGTQGGTEFNLSAVYDNLERAAAAEGGEDDPHKKGLEMIFHQFKELLAKEGVKEIEAKGKEFDPELMNAVMHIEDESLGENVVAQVFQAGFELNGKVLRHAIVQVAN